MYRKYMATAAAVLVSVSLMMTGCNGNHAVKDNNIQQSEAVNAKSEDSTRTAAGSRTGTKQGTQKEGNTTGSAAQKRENQKTGNGSGNTNENTNVNNINITNGNGNGNGNGGRKGSKGGTGSGKTSTSTTKNVYNIYETHNHNTTNKTENHYSTTNNSRTENKYSSTTVNQEQNISETNNTDITNENYNYGDQSIGKTENTNISNEENNSYTRNTDISNEENNSYTENTENNINQNDGSQWFGGSGNDQGNESYAYESGESSTEDPSDDDYDNTTWAGFDDPDPVHVTDAGGTSGDGATEEYTYPAEDTEIGGDEDWTGDDTPEYIDEPVDDYPGYTDSEPAEEDPGYTDDEPAEEDPGYTDDDWADDGGSDDQGDESETFGQYVNPQLADEETGDTWELLDNGSEESVDVPSDSGSMQVSSDGTGSEAIDVSGNSTISFTVSMEDGSDGSGWIEVCDQEGNVIGQTGQVDAGGSTNASFDVSGTNTIQFRACTDSGETVNLQISNLEMN